MTGAESQHEKYEELCALATAGGLTPEERETLFSHLNNCSQCSLAFTEYRSLVIYGLPFLADESRVADNQSPFDENAALNRLVSAIEAPRTRAHLDSPLRVAAMLARQNNPKLTVRDLARGLPRSLIAACLLIAIATGSFWMGVRDKKQTAPVAKATPDPVSRALMTELAAEKKNLQKSVQVGELQMAELQHQISASSQEVEKLRSESDAAAASLTAMTAKMADQQKQSEARIAALTQQGDASAIQLRDTKTLYQAALDQLNTLHIQHEQDMLRMASLNDKVNRLSASLGSENAIVKTDEEYLTSDRDIRDLIGARNLYIADIIDVNEDGQSRKPFGRVFYTKTKSLIFYAYDLDRQPGVRRTSTFQVWGRTRATDRKPVNLGILYMDSEANRRWTLKVDDPRQLAQLDAVFVTIEPRPQAERPTGKPFLYASLRREPNHP